MSTEMRPYGSWSSPVSSDMLAAATVKMRDVYLADDDTLYWIESRPHEGGRFVVLRQGAHDQEPVELTPPPFNVRTRVHEYGGGPLAIAGTTLYFSHYHDHRLYRQRLGEHPQAITPDAKMRYADLVWDPARERLVSVREDHTASDIHAVSTIVALDPDANSAGTVLVDGYDFFMYPRISPDGKQLSWICWNHPNMPWDGTELWVGTIGEDGRIHGRLKIAGGTEESIFQPSWSPEGILYFVSDRTGWWNLYRLRDGAVEAVTQMQAEFGRPNWVFNLTTYGFADRNIIAVYSQNGYDYVVSIDSETRILTPLEMSYTRISQVQVNRHRVAFLAGSPSVPVGLMTMDRDTGRMTAHGSHGHELEEADISVPQAVEFPTERSLTAHAWYYPPKNHRFTAPDGEKPPLIVFSHGGPTGNSPAVFDLEIQYWTTRGFAVADVNYGGSSGYGRAYRNRLYDAWGIVDVEDCTNAALYLADLGLADRHRLAIRGGSAGGYTTLACLTFRDAFAVGASYYGVSDLTALARETHKFESRYLDRLVGPWPEAQSIYDNRSPLMHVDQLNCPIIFFQGLDDRIVLPNQAEMMVAGLRERGIPVAYLAFEGEGHGFVSDRTIVRSTNAELYFYCRVLGISVTEPLEPVAIDSWPDE